jgi:two-component system, cell cycle sensor histidine kinase and response regulator CckA
VHPKTLGATEEVVRPRCANFRTLRCLRGLIALHYRENKCLVSHPLGPDLGRLAILGPFKTSHTKRAFAKPGYHSDGNVLSPRPQANVAPACFGWRIAPRWTVLGVLMIVGNSTTSLRRRLQRLFGPQVDITWVCSPGLGAIAGELTRIEDVIFDLATRAKSKLPVGGRVAIEWANVQVEDASPFGEGMRPGSYIMLELTCWRSTHTDSWIFAPMMAEIAELCPPCDFAQSQAKIRYLGGQICEYNEPGRAFTIRAFFPSASPDRVNLDCTVTENSEKLQILLVEDEMFVRDVACEYLESEGYAVLSARTGKEALQLFEQNGPFDLLLTDVVMPGINGRDLSKMLTALHPQLKTIFMSGYSEHSALHFEGDDAKRPFIAKPFTLESLSHVVKAVIGSSST